MFSDLEVITRTFPDDMDVLRVYAIGDVHVGSQEFDERAIRRKIEIIKNDDAGVVCLCGDLADYGLRNSKTNVYLQTMSPHEQQEYVYELFLPIVDKITALVPGNHEERLVRETGINPLLSLACKWGIEDVYRENAALTKYSFGRYYKNSCSIVFVGLTTHGSSRNKHQRFTACYSNIDFSISGHTHQPWYSPKGRIVVDVRSGTATLAPYKEIVVDAHLKPGGYSMKYEYEIPAPPELQYLELTAGRELHSRGIRKIMSYHSIQL